MPLFVEFPEQDLKLLQQERLGHEGAIFEDLGHRHKVRSTIVNDT